ncbi:hypothetical protein HYALB_00006632 [Hymenoscyphus albidus]|uniref:Uncharacterized protein n=1 Tax=Hymenoscyphus albidus TaxID=595503 RepID=A0A9N9LXK7_9HELO|nr:hypothetical protein HYALB_00006632 [Hymenoscyphus albidus]
MFEDFLKSANNNPVIIQHLCDSQRSKRNEEQKHHLLSDDFKGVRPDQYLINYLNDPKYVDPRNNLCIWARPTEAVMRLVAEIQKELLTLAPGIWTTPLESLHMTVLEIVHTATTEEVNSCAKKLQPCLKEMVNYTLDHRTRLVKPKLNFDDAAVALSFVPAAGEDRDGASEDRDDASEDRYTYLHLRSDSSDICSRNGVEVAARYETTSSHMTVARFVRKDEHGEREAMELWISKIESLNRWLEDECFPQENLQEKGRGEHVGLEWYIGAERGLEIRTRDLWYGGGVSVEVGEHF